MRQGWYVIPGVQDGIVTLEDQMIAVWPAVAECNGKTVVDLGCAEGLVGREFARAGAVMVTGIDSIPEHLEVAREQCRGLPMRFVHMNLNDVGHMTFSADIVLALNVIHKLRFPEAGLRFASRSSSSLLLLRSGRGSVDGIIRSKHHPENTCDSAALLRAEGFALEKTVDGPADRDEPIEYWRRCATSI